MLPNPRVRNPLLPLRLVPASLHISDSMAKLSRGHCHGPFLSLDVGVRYVNWTWKHSSLCVPKSTREKKIVCTGWWATMVCTIDKVHIDKETAMLTMLNRKTLSLSFKYPIVAFGAAVSIDLAEAIGVYCDNSSMPCFARLWVISSALGSHPRCNAYFPLR